MKSNSIYKIFLLLISSVITIIALLCIKKYIANGNFTYILLSAVLYLILIYVYLKLFKDGELSSLYVVLQILQILIVSIIGFILYKEKFTYNKIIGIISGIIGVYFLL
jgi:multidrug transporter EmrE-like cation transporter